VPCSRPHSGRDTLYDHCWSCPLQEGATSLTRINTGRDGRAVVAPTPIRRGDSCRPSCQQLESRTLDPEETACSSSRPNSQQQIGAGATFEVGAASIAPLGPGVGRGDVASVVDGEITRDRATASYPIQLVHVSPTRSHRQTLVPFLGMGLGRSDVRAFPSSRCRRSCVCARRAIETRIVTRVRTEIAILTTSRSTVAPQEIVARWSLCRRRPGSECDGHSVQQCE
jgi:hypothetical protein